MQFAMNAEKIIRCLQTVFGDQQQELDEGHRFARAYFAALHFGELLGNSIQTGHL